jgi:hypothetical protein
MVKAGVALEEHKPLLPAEPPALVSCSLRSLDTLSLVVRT